MPMLDDEEFRQVISFKDKGAGQDVRDQMFGAVLAEYERITGFHETNPTAIYHHPLSIDGHSARKMCGSPMHPVGQPA
jgi:hypothetical protein